MGNGDFGAKASRRSPQAIEQVEWDRGRRGMTDFFISYTSADSTWAQWIAYVLEEEHFSVTVQAWDFRPGKNFVLEMQDGAAKADRTLMVLSPDYLHSQFASPEWAAAYGHDPQGREMKLVPVMVRSCEPKGLLTSIVQIRIAGLSEEAARQELIKGLDKKRAKPQTRPAFPGEITSAGPRAFPGSGRDTGRTSSDLIPALKLRRTDIEKRRFANEGFGTIKAAFKANLQTASENERISTDFRVNTETEFQAEIFIDGDSACSCRVKLGQPYSENNISYAEGRQISDGMSNEILALSETEGLEFQALMGMGSYSQKKNFDLKRLSPSQAANYLWRCFVGRLEDL